MIVFWRIYTTVAMLFAGSQTFAQGRTHVNFNGTMTDYYTVAVDSPQQGRRYASTEGSYIVKKDFKIYGHRNQPTGLRYARGSCEGIGMKNNCLVPCLSAAAKGGKFRLGEAVCFEPGRQPTCAATGRKIECVRIDDTGGGLAANAHIDVFQGICEEKNYNRGTQVCRAVGMGR